MVPGTCRMKTKLCPGWEKPHIPGLQALPAGPFWFSATCHHQSTSYYNNRRGIPGHHNYIFFGLSPSNHPRALASVQSVSKAVSSLCGHTVLFHLLSLYLTHTPLTKSPPLAVIVPTSYFSRLLHSVLESRGLLLLCSSQTI